MAMIQLRSLLLLVVLAFWFDCCSGEDAPVKCSADKILTLSGLTSDKSPLGTEGDLVLYCNATKKTVKTAIWKLNDNQSIISQYVHESSDGKSSFVKIPKPTVEHVGQYDVEIFDTNDVNIFKGTINVKCQPIVKVIPDHHIKVEEVDDRLYRHDGLIVNEEDSANITCSVIGYPEPEIKWLKGNIEIDENFERYIVNGDTLHIAKTVYDDRADYFCIASNGVGKEAKIVTLLRVKDRWRAVWPALGILAEAIALAVIIAICEFRQKKAEQLDVTPRDDDD